MATAINGGLSSYCMRSMKARIGNRVVEIDRARVQGGAMNAGHRGRGRIGGGAAVVSSDMIPCTDHVATRSRVGNPAPAPSRYRSKLEADFALYLIWQCRSGSIAAWWYEPVSLKLPGPRNRYTPDFLVLAGDGLTFYEVKGWSPSYDRSIVKLKTAAGLTPWATFILVTRDKMGWHEKRIQAVGGG